jgi:hypothetical protein
MRILVGVVLALFIAWSGYWVVGQRAIKGQIGTILAADLPEGMTFEQTDYRVAGFPNRFDLNVTAPRYLDALTGWGWSADFAQVFAMTWKPWHLIAALPHDQQIATPFGPVDLVSQRFVASLRVAPSIEVSFEEAVLEVEAARLTAAFLPPITVDKLVVALKQEPAQGPAYRLGVQAANLTPLIAQATGGNLTTGQLDVVFYTTVPLDRNLGAPNTEPQSAEQGLVELTGLDLRRLSLDWGPVTVSGSGRLVRISGGFAEGEIALKVSGWQDLAARLADFGFLRPEIAPTISVALDLIAKEQGYPSILDLPLRFKSGRSYLGPLPLGLAPMLAQRQ